MRESVSSEEEAGEASGAEGRILRLKTSGAGTGRSESAAVGAVKGYRWWWFRSPPLRKWAAGNPLSKIVGDGGGSPADCVGGEEDAGEEE
ncbi:hypothetical protein LINPERHAP1_LOCUS14022 [Linum perenne]